MKSPAMVRSCITLVAKPLPKGMPQGLVQPALRIQRSVSKFYLRLMRMHAGVDAGEHGKL